MICSMPHVKNKKYWLTGYLSKIDIILDNSQLSHVKHEMTGPCIEDRDSVSTIHLMVLPGKTQ